MSKITVDFKQTVNKIKPVHGVGQPPFVGVDYSMLSYLKDANIPYSRLHDVGGPYGGYRYVDIPNLFRDFDADPQNPDSYDFAFTDGLVTALIENNTEPFFRLGVTIENYATTKAYRIFPPEDNLKWAKICEGVIKHYTQGWANGFHYKIEYWEIWNEPDNYEDPLENQMWRGTKEQYYELYHVAASYLKQRFPHLKIGGYASCGFYALTGETIEAAKSSPRFEYFIEFFDGFLEYIKKHNSPLDFFSWHSYDSVEKNRIYADYARKCLDQAGFVDTETSCNEWHCVPEKCGTIENAANNTAMLIMFQNSPLDNAMFYDARVGVSIYGGLFHPMKKVPYPLYYGFYAFGKLYALENQVKVQCDNDKVYALAASNGSKGGVLVVNLGDEIALELDFQGQALINCCTIDETHNFDVIQIPKVLNKNTVIYMETETP